MSTTDSTPFVERFDKALITAGEARDLAFETADRARAYVALLGMVIPELDTKTLGTCIEKWAAFMACSGASEQACLAALRPFRDACPVISVIRACQILGLDIRDVMAEELAA